MTAAGRTGWSVGALCRSALPGIALLLLAGEAVACGFHAYAPGKTLVDRLLDADHVVLARNAPEAPFRYRVAQTLRDGGRAVEIGQLVDSATRRRLAADADGAVVFAFDGERGAWASLGFAQGARLALVERVIARGPAWDGGYPAERLALAEALQDHADPGLRRLALAELDRAPYALLRTVDLRLSAAELMAGIGSPSGYSEIPIRVLLLGLSGEDAARAVLRARFARGGTLVAPEHLGAYATALVEIDGIAGVERVTAAVLSDPAAAADRVEAVVEALAIHAGAGDAALRARIGTVLAQLLRDRPDTLSAVARQFGSRGDWSMAPAVGRLVGEGRVRSGSALIAGARYVAMARRAAGGGGAPRP